MALKLFAKQCNMQHLFKPPQIHFKFLSSINTFQSSPLHQGPIHRSFCAKPDNTNETSSNSDDKQEWEIDYEPPQPQQESTSEFRIKWLKRVCQYLNHQIPICIDF